MKLSRVEGVDGLLATVNLDGKEVTFLLRADQLRDLIRATHKLYGPDFEPGAILSRPILELVHSGTVELEEIPDTQIGIYTVQLGELALIADVDGLKGLRAAIDQILALRGGPATVQ